MQPNVQSPQLNRSMSVATKSSIATSQISSLPSINSLASPPHSHAVPLLQKNRKKMKIPLNDPVRFVAFVVSITKYKYLNSIEDCISNDTDDLVEILTNPKIGQFDTDNVVVATNPTKKDLLKKLKQFTKRCRKIRKKTRGRITVLVYLAGHTGKVKGGRRAGDYLLTSECKPSTQKRLTQGAVKIKDIMKKIYTLNAKHATFFLHGNHATERLQGIQAIQITLDIEGTEFQHLSEKDKLTIKGVQHDIDHDILKNIVKNKKQRKTITTRSKQLEKMSGTYISDLDGDDDDDDDDSEEDEGEMFTHATTSSSSSKKKKKKRGPSSNIVCVSACMSGQTSRYGDPIHGEQPRNSLFGLHLCAGLCGRTIHQNAMERARLKKRVIKRKENKEQEEQYKREQEEEENNRRLQEQMKMGTLQTTDSRPTLPPRFQPVTETDEVFIDFNNKVQYKNRYAEKDSIDATLRG